MRFFREHWFGGLVSLLVAVYVLMFVLVLAAPRQDEKQRGFVKCTAVMKDELLKCQKSLFCALSVVASNSFCNVSVIGEGVALGLGGEQSTPWANYLFEPQISAGDEKNHPDYQKFYDENPDLARQMSDLKKKYKNLEGKVIENEKSN